MIKPYMCIYMCVCIYIYNMDVYSISRIRFSHGINEAAITPKNERHEQHVNSLGQLRNRSWIHLGRSSAALGPLLDRSWALLNRSWIHLGRS
jgi:hypothetical protein